MRVWTWRSDGDSVVYDGLTAGVDAVAFGPDDRLVAARGNGVVHVWRCEVCASMPRALAERRTTRELTADERKTFFETT